MEHIIITNQNSNVEMVNSNIIHKLAEEAQDCDASSNMTGNLQTTNAYEDDVDFLTTKFPGLSINATQGLYVSFADPEVRRVMQTNYGDITGSQFAAITSLGNIFLDNTDIETFDELGRSGVTKLPPYGFAGCTNLRSIDVSKIVNLQSDGGLNITAPFSGCANLQSLCFTNLQYAYITSAGNTINGQRRAGFEGCTSLRSVEFPELFCCAEFRKNEDYTSGVLNDGHIRVNGFYGCSSLEYVSMPKANVTCEGGDRWHAGNFDNMPNLKIIDLGNVLKFGDYFITGNTPNLKALVVRNKYFVPPITQNKSEASITNFLGNANAIIYVDDTLYDNGDYTNASYWSSIMANVQPIRNYDKDSIMQSV